MDDKKDESINTDLSDINLGEIDKEDTSAASTPTPSESQIPPTETLPPVAPPPQQAVEIPPKDNWFKKLLRTKKGKVLAVVVGLVVIAGILFAIPASRYGILGNFIKKDAQLIIVDKATNKPVTQATIEFGSFSAKTDTAGKVSLQDIPVGEYPVKITKKYYKDITGSYTVPIFGNAEEETVKVEATGRQVTVMLTNVITKKPLADATISVDETASVTNEKGEAVIVLPADKQTMKASVKHDSYNTAEVELKVTDQTDANPIALTPKGTVYYLSKATGKINVMKANLDGTSAAVVIEATGNESDSETSLLAARDWQYMMLSGKRKAGVAGQLYVVDAKSDSLKTVDEGNVTITPVGWAGHNFFYTVIRGDKQQWEDKREALKVYNAETGKLAVVDETTGTGTGFMNQEGEVLGRVYITDSKVVYAKNVSRGSGFGTQHAKKPAIMAVNPDGTQLQRVKEFDFTSSFASVDARLYEPQAVYFRVQLGDKPAEFYEYENSSLKSVTTDDDKFFNTFYPTFLVSPDGQKTFWFEPRNGKNALFVGDKNGSNGKELTQQSEYKAYGWFSDRYILLSKGGSELYIASVDGPLDAPVKITNYHKPAALNFEGYGYGYGGF